MRICGCAGSWLPASGAPLADWIRFVDDYREKSVAAYEAALTKDQDAMVDASGYLSESCLACHRVYRRERMPGDPTQRCIPGPPAAPR